MNIFILSEGKNFNDRINMVKIKHQILELVKF